MGSPTPSLDSTGRAHSLSSLTDQNEYNSLSSGHSPSTASPTSLSSSCGNTDSSSSGCNQIGNSNALSSHCGICQGLFNNPKVLPCFHTFCESCLSRAQEHPGKITCPRCLYECPLSTRGITNVLSDFSINNNILDDLNLCGICKNVTCRVTMYCTECSTYYCHDCAVTHQFGNLDVHTMLNISSSDPNEWRDHFKNDFLADEKSIVFCPRHKAEILKYFCLTCDIPICKECTHMDHPAGLHDYDSIMDVGPRQLEMITEAMQEVRVKANDIKTLIKNLDHSAGKLQVQFHKAQNEVNDTFIFYRSMLEERKNEILKELQSVSSAKQLAISMVGQKSQDIIEKIYQTCDFGEKLMKQASVTQCLLFKKLLDVKFQNLMSYSPEISIQNASDLEFVSNYQAIQVGVRNTFGYVRSSGEVNVGPAKQPPIARPNISSYVRNGSANTNGYNSSSNSSLLNGFLDRQYTNGLDINSSSTVQPPYESNIISKRFNQNNNQNNNITSSSSCFANGFNNNDNGINSTIHYEKWSNGGGDIFQNGHNDFSDTDSVFDLASKMLHSSMYPPKSQIKRQKMIYHCKFGEFGALEGQFTEPSGVAVNAQNDIIVADTNNHRIQIFDKEGRFKFQFGECGKRDGQLLYPNRVAVVKPSGDIIVTERSPTHQIQIYNQYGQFIRKFGATILQHPRGITVDNKGRIVVVECKVMRVIIFDQVGNVLQKFGCSKYLEFPNGVVVNDRQEIFISDNRAHCVKVFNYEGSFLRQIGSEGITNYPIGVGINSAGEILIADNHNNFNLTIFTQDGQLVSAMESKVKHAQCFDVSLMDDGSVILASKDYRLYIYRYLTASQLCL